MIKRFTQFTFILLFHVSAFSQKGLPALGKISIADLKLTQCPYDKDAIAFKLIDWGSVHYDRGTSDMLFKTIYEKRVRIKILKESGIKYANITIPFYSNNNIEKISKLEAYSYNLENSNTVQTTTLKKNAAYTKKINNYYSELILPIANVKVGSVIEYKYTLESETTGHLKDWYFQEEIPTRHSEFQLKIPLVYTYTIQPSIIDSLTISEDVVEELINTNEGVVRTNSLVKNFVMQNLKALPDEPYMGATKDYQQRLQFQLAQINYGKGDIKYINSTWKDIVKTLLDDEDFGKQLQKDIKSTDAFITLLKSKKDDEEKIAFAVNYFQKYFTWNKQESIYSYNGIKETWESKTGSSGDINLLFIKLLKEVGVNILPILFSTRDNGTVNTFFPFIEQFNTTLCYVILNNKTYIIDATDKFISPQLIPEKILNCHGFIVNDTVTKWVVAKEDKNKYKVVMATKAHIDENGVMQGESIVSSAGYSRLNRLKNWYISQPEFIENYFSANQQAIKLNNIQVKNTEDNNAMLEQIANFTYTLGSSGNYKYFTTNIFTDFVKNPFTKEERSTDIDFGYLQDYHFFGNYIIPFGYEFDDLPKNISFVMPDKSITLNRFVEVDENNLTIRSMIEFNQPYYSASTYPELATFYKKMLDLLNEQIVIKKK